MSPSRSRWNTRQTRNCNIARKLDLAFEAIDHAIVRRNFGQQCLKGHPVLQFLILGLVDLARSAAYEAQDAVAACDQLARDKNATVAQRGVIEDAAP